MKFVRPLSFIAIAFLAPSFSAMAQVVFSGAGPDAVAIQPVVDAFRASLGSLNANNPGSVGSGRREINWDGVPAGNSAPNPFPADFFNGATPGLARGVVLSTPGTGFQVSSTAASGIPVEFGNIDPSYTGLFRTFSAEKLFTPIGSTITDVSFFIPGTATPALTTGFGSVFSDVDLANVSSLQFFDAASNSLGTFFAPSFAGNETLSFLGVIYSDAIVSRVRITSGNSILAAGNTTNDLVVMDDWIYGEPRAAAVSTPDAGSTALLFGIALGLLPFARHSGRRPI
jgi:hypothetical protein